MPPYQSASYNSREVRNELKSLGPSSVMRASPREDKAVEITTSEPGALDGSARHH